MDNRKKFNPDAFVAERLISKDDALFLKSAYASHKASNATETEEEYHARFIKECQNDGIHPDDIDLAWNTIQSCKNRKD